MGYPTLDGPYGYKPVNLIGGQVFAGSTREYAVAYNYGTSIFFGDPVVITNGFVNIATLPINTTNTTVGVFMGCSYTDPVTKQKRFSQYYPANTLAGDIKAIICDDPDAVFRIAVVTAAGVTTIGSASQLTVGVNLAGSTTTGNAATGNSTLGVVGAAATTANAGFRVLSLVPDTQVATQATYSSGGAPAATTVTVSGLTVGQVLPIGTDIFQLVPATGQLQFTGASLTSAITVTSATSQVLSPTTAFAVQAAGTLALVQTPEVLAKINFNVHRYNIA
jgi:hypothetical protein